MNKLQRTLVVILAAQLVLAAIVFWPRPSADAQAQPLLAGVKADDITSLTIRDAGGSALALARQGVAGQAQWVLSDAGDFPVDGAKVTPLLTKLAGLTTGRLVAQTPASHRQLGVADDGFQRRLDVGTAGGAAYTLLVGTSAGQSSHVRVGGQDAVYLAGEVAPWDFNADPASWIDTKYVEISAADVYEFTLANANGQWTFVRDGSGWKMDGLTAGEQTDAAQVTALLDQALSLRITEPLGKTEESAYGLAQPAALLTLKSKRGDTEEVATLAIGAPEAVDNSYVAKLSESPYYVRVAEFGAKDLIEKKRENFLQAPPTAQPLSGTPPTRAARTPEPTPLQ